MAVRCVRSCVCTILHPSSRVQSPCVVFENGVGCVLGDFTDYCVLIVDRQGARWVLLVRLFTICVFLSVFPFPFSHSAFRWAVCGRAGAGARQGCADCSLPPLRGGPGADSYSAPILRPKTPCPIKHTAQVYHAGHVRRHGPLAGPHRFTRLSSSSFDPTRSRRHP